MALFTSPREKQLWIYALIILIAIISTLAFGRPLSELLSNQDVRAGIFLLGMILIGLTILFHAIKTRPGKTEITIWLGFATVAIMLFLRLGAAERGHMMEYSVLAIFIHMALLERRGQGYQIWKTALLAFTITLVIGVMDECIQIFLPSRVFDPIDILFNGFVAFVAIGSRMILLWVRQLFSKT